MIIEQPQEWSHDSGFSGIDSPSRPSWKLESIELFRRISVTASLFKSGVNLNTATALAHELYNAANFAAVAVTERQTTLAYVGPLYESEAPHLERFCPAVRLCLEIGKNQTCRHNTEDHLLSNCWSSVQPEKERDSQNPHWLVAIPLENELEVCGTLLIFGSELSPIESSNLELARWAAQEVSLNLEMCRLRGSAGQLAEAELKALRAQISPHFLFNTLNTIAALVRLDAERARELIVDFASFFRRTLKQHGEFVLLSEELDYVKHYLRLEQVRFGTNIRVSYDIGTGTEQVVVPVLTVQPLVENAVNHGLAPQIGGGTIVIQTRTIDDGDIVIEVNDNGVGMDEATLAKALKPEHSEGLGMALSNINERLHKLFGSQYSLKIESELGKGTKVVFRVPRVKRV
ncbi:MAG: histidine kinase [Chloroflexi bacterium]|uniref:histidine kinase n=1 Tax=Candidatus Chlorohelix allophototropha TaxID=3003348 RepID=A0A8T7M2M3_9CHLR|nr:histidine kinase [Chloroflexota bacterium]WJW67268.1 histidine kinase [Chloroflexota bacterium L227-S17]